jgi:hypothetical protein
MVLVRGDIGVIFDLGFLIFDLEQGVHRRQLREKALHEFLISEERDCLTRITPIFTNFGRFSEGLIRLERANPSLNDFHVVGMDAPISEATVSGDEVNEEGRAVRFIFMVVR